MSAQDSPKSDTNDQEATPHQNEEEVIDEGPKPEGDVPNEEIEAELERELGVEDELAKWKDIAARAAAELENFRKRMAREKMDAVRYANQRLLEELLPVIDNFEMGMMAAEQDQGSMIYQGMAMVQKQLGDFFASQNVEEVSALGEIFDPNIHDAISQEESDEHEEGSVIRVTRKGYRLGDRLIRPANVVVAKSTSNEEEKEEAE